MSSIDQIVQISPIELKNEIDSNKNFVLLDVREPHELEICKLSYIDPENKQERFINIPMGDLRFRLDELEPFKNAEIVIVCRSGRRSNMAALFMKEFGFNNVKNLSGGMLAWSDQIDPTITKY